MEQNCPELPEEQTEPVSAGRKALPYLVNAGVGLVLAAVTCLLRDLFSQENAAEVMRVLADAFFVAGILLACVYALRRLAREGVFFGLGYIGSFCLHALFPITAADKNGRAKNYYDWCDDRRAKAAKKPKIPLGQLLIGIAFVLLAVGFTVAYTLLSA